MTTFSQAIDTLMLETNRRDLLASLTTWMNQTIRDVHAANVPGQGAMPVKFGENLIEDIITTNTDTSYVWPIPNPTRHQLLIAAYYPDVGKYAHPTTPGTTYTDNDAVDDPYKVYRSGPNYIFDGYGQSGSQIQIAYYEYPKRLLYYPAGITRPAEFANDTEVYTYQNPWALDIAPNNEAAGLLLSTNWLLSRWEDLIMQGTRAKLYNRTDDGNRGKASYSAYMEQRPVMVANESHEFIGFYRR